jgi:hypothetical protein
VGPQAIVWRVVMMIGAVPYIVFDPWSGKRASSPPDSRALACPHGSESRALRLILAGAFGKPQLRSIRPRSRRHRKGEP